MNLLERPSTRDRLQSLATWRDDVLCGHKRSAAADNVAHAALEYHHLELRLHPPNVTFSDDAQGRTTITIDSANRPGTLVEVVQGLTELGFNVCSARISSDGGWFFDTFTTTEAIKCKHKQSQIKRLLGAEVTPFDQFAMEDTVFELAGPDRAGLLADILSLLKAHGCNVQTAAVWTSNARVAFVLSVSETAPFAAANGHLMGHSAALSLSSANSSACDLSVSRSGSPGAGQGPQQAVKDPRKLEILQLLLDNMMRGCHKGDVMHIAEVNTLRGPVHYERRLHELLLRMEEADWEESDLRAHYEAVVGTGQGELPSWERPPSPTSLDSQQAPSPRVAPLERASSASAVGTQPAPSFHLHSHSCLLPGLNLAADGLSSLSLGSVGHLNSLAPLQPLQAATAWLSSLSSTGTPQNGSQQSLQGHGQAVRAASANAASLAAAATCAQLQLVSPKFSKPLVTIRHNARLRYWLVDIRCKDRKKLFFDTVCTLASLEYDIFHASVDVEGVDLAHQVYYIRRRTGDSSWSQSEAAKLCYQLEASIQRRFPRGVKIRIQSWQPYDLVALTHAWRDAGLLITRAKVRPCLSGPAGLASGARPAVSNTFYLLDAATQTAPDPTVVQQACVSLGGVAMGASSTSSSPAPGSQPQHQQAPGGYAGSTPAGGSTRPPRHPLSATAGTAANGSTGSLDPIRERCPHAAFGFLLLQHRSGGVGSPLGGSVSSSM